MAIKYKTVRAEHLSTKQQDRFLVIDHDTGEILDDANGYGYKSVQNAHRGFSYKLKNELADKEYEIVREPMAVSPKFPKSGIANAGLYFDRGKDGGCETIGCHIVCYMENGGKTEISIGEKLGRGTNNTAEYNALIFGLLFLVNNGFSGQLSIYGDSKLVVNQVKGSWRCNHGHLYALIKEARELLKEFDNYSITWIPRNSNKKADRAGRAAG